jgi:alkylation response protein AidB-like acyl-CoA dehydrogenase
MTSYTVPRRDMEFILEEVLDTGAHFQKIIGGEEVNMELVNQILDAGSAICENVLVPLNEVGDQQGCKIGENGVETPAGFKEAYQQFVDGGWVGLTGEEEFGGQGLPPSLNVVMSEMVGAANWSFGMYPGLSGGAANALRAHATPEQKETYLTKLVSGEWTGNMCLTEPHCGSDLGLLRTKAVATANGTYKLSGTKIFISGGEHDMTDNILSLVIARVEGAPAGTKGISLFVVPRYNIETGEANGVTCGSLEHKMGIHGNATCVLNFDDAEGILIGEENKGLGYMFTMMNTARVGTALQGICHSEVSLQKSTAYARDRLQMRSLTGPKNPEGPADPIIVHPDVRRMLLTQKALTEGGRAFVYWLAQQLEAAQLSTDGPDAELYEMTEFLTPIAKAFMTETGFESVNHGLQIFGGHGFIAEWGMEQQVRDCRISMLYEGTTGIQALDLLGRKVFGNGGKSLAAFTKLIHKFCEANADNADVAPHVVELQRLIKEWSEITGQIGAKAMENADEVGAASVDYLMYSGYVVYAFFWAQMAAVAGKKIAAGDDNDFYKAKMETAKFYFERLLPRTATHAKCIESGAESLMGITEEQMYMG